LKKFLLFVVLVLGWAPQAHAQFFPNIFGTAFCITVDTSSFFSGGGPPPPEVGFPSGAICIPLDDIEAALNDRFSRLGPGECLETSFGTVCMPAAPTPPPVPPISPEALYTMALQQGVVPFEQASVQWTLDFFFPDINLRVPAILSYISKQWSRCTGRSEGDLCNIIPPSECFDGRCVVSFRLLTEGGILADVVRRVVQSILEDGCAGAGGDVDEDFVCTAQDNCPTIPNSNQLDTDGNGAGDACECGLTPGLDRDGDGQADCVDACLLFSALPGFIPNVNAPACGCQPLALVGQGQRRRWTGSGGAGNVGVPHLDAQRCSLSASAPATEGTFVLKDVTRQAINAALPQHLHFGALGSGFSASTEQTITTKMHFPNGSEDVVAQPSALNYANPPTEELRAAIDAQVGATLFYDFLRTIVGASGPLVSIADPSPGVNGTMISIINRPSSNETDLADFVANLNGGSFVKYPPKTQPFNAAAALDVVGHEWFHAFTALAVRSSLRPAGLSLRVQELDKAGLAEEAFADGVGQAFESVLIAEGRIPGKAANATIAEDSGVILVDLANPRTPAINNTTRPDHVRHIDFQLFCSSDRPEETSGVTSGSGSGGIPFMCRGPYLKANFLLSATGERFFPLSGDRTAGRYGAILPPGATITSIAPTVRVTGVGPRTFARIAFRASQSFWGRGQNYKHYAAAMVRAAADIFGVGSTQAISTRNAYNAVGLFVGRITVTPTITPLGTGTVTVTGPSLVFQDDPLTFLARPATGRTFAGFVVRTPTSTVTLPPTQNPATIPARIGLRVEARFN